MRNLVTVLMMCALSGATLAQERRAARGGQEGGGGSGTKADFVSWAVSVYAWLDKNPGTISVTAEQFSSVIDANVVRPTNSTLTYRGEEVDAYYCATKDNAQCTEADVILVNIERVGKLQSDGQKWRVAAHEFFRRLKAKGVEVAEDDGYELSSFGLSDAIISKAFGNEEELLKRLMAAHGQTFDVMGANNEQWCGYHLEIETTIKPFKVILTPVNGRTKNGAEIPCYFNNTEVFSCDSLNLRCERKYKSRDLLATHSLLLLADGNLVSTDVNPYHPRSYKLVKRNQ